MASSYSKKGQIPKRPLANTNSTFLDQKDDMASYNLNDSWTLLDSGEKRN